MVKDFVQGHLNAQGKPIIIVLVGRAVLGAPRPDCV